MFFFCFHWDAPAGELTSWVWLFSILHVFSLSRISHVFGIRVNPRKTLCRARLGLNYCDMPVKACVSVKACVYVDNFCFYDKHAFYTL